MSDASEQLRERWSRLWHRLGVPVAKLPQIDSLLKAYQSPERAYHNLHHISQCLAELDALQVQCETPNEVELALWYHDVIYDAKRHDNEKLSADQAADAMRLAGIDSSVINRATVLILATKHATPPAAGDAQIIVDIDLSILGRPQAEFDVYEYAIRREFSFVDEASFRTGRSAILKKFLDRSVIYRTEVMQQKYEAAARANLQRSIDRLTSKN